MPQDKPHVSLAPCPDYDRARVQDAVEAALAPFGGIQSVVTPGARVLIKINLLNDTPPEKAVVTHPEVTRALVRLVKQAGGEPAVGELAGPGEKGITLRAFEVSGTRAVCEEEGARIAPFSTQGFAEVTVGANRHMRTLHIARDVLDADVVIGIAKLKTHIQALYTGTVKNYFGCLPLKYRKRAHSVGRYRPFCETLVDIYCAVNPSFTLLDGIVGMEGRGPNRGTPRELGLLLAAEDHVACDALAMHLIGLDPERYPLLAYARERGLGEHRLEHIRVAGARPEEHRVRFQPPPRFMLNPPGFLARAATWMLSQKPRIDPERCEACGICAASCPANAITLSPKAFIDERACIECLCCMELCPHDAVYETAPAVARVLRRTKDAVLARMPTR